MQKITFVPLIALLQCCTTFKEKSPDATGMFEAEEITVPAQVSGILNMFNVEEGDVLQADTIVGYQDTAALHLQNEVLAAKLSSLNKRTVLVLPQQKILSADRQKQVFNAGVISEEMSALKVDQKRYANLVAADAMPAKTLDDINAQVNIKEAQLRVAEAEAVVIEKRISAHREMTAQENEAILSDREWLEKEKAQIENQIIKAHIRNTLTGRITRKYLKNGEWASPGARLYNIANIQKMKLRVAVTANQLPQLKPGQQVQVLPDGMKQLFPGKIISIASTANFKPNNIQTKDERALLVYEVVISVSNPNEVLKSGMYAGVYF